MSFSRCNASLLSSALMTSETLLLLLPQEIIRIGMVAKAFMIRASNPAHCHCMLPMAERMHMWSFTTVAAYRESSWSICDKRSLSLMATDTSEPDEANRHREVWYLAKVSNILLMNR